jgi:hypothetical protein
MKLAARVLPNLKPTPSKLGAMLGLFLVAAGSVAFIEKKSFLICWALVYPENHFGKTASGERYDKAKFTFGAANANFAPYAWVKVTNQRTHLVSYARRNDDLRAPESYRYKARFSEAVARELGMTDTDLVQVEVVPEASVPAHYFGFLSKAPQPPPTPSNGMNHEPVDGSTKKNQPGPQDNVPPGQYGKIIDLENQPENVQNFYGVQVISLSDHDAALRYSQQPNVLGLGEDIYIEPFRQPSGIVMYRVLIGKYANRTDAQTVNWQLRQQGFKGCTLQMYQ